MTKHRLTKHNRDTLLAHAKSKAIAPIEQAAYDDAYSLARTYVVEVLEQAYPTKDMKIVEKYKLASPSEHVTLRLRVGGEVEFRFRDKFDAERKLPSVLTPHAGGWPVFLFDAVDQTQAYERYAETRNIYQTACNKILNAYSALILNSPTYEDVLNVWPEALEIQEKILGQKFGALTRMPQELLTLIHKDHVDRMRAGVAADAKKNVKLEVRSPRDEGRLHRFKKTSLAE